jgi:hypothetical protein
MLSRYFDAFLMMEGDLGRTVRISYSFEYHIFFFGFNYGHASYSASTDPISGLFCTCLWMQDWKNTKWEEANASAVHYIL